MADAPLDMRMDQGEGLTAASVVNTWSQEELRQIIARYGEERYAPQIAGAIARRRADKPIETTLELVEIIRGAMPPKALREKQHPAKRTFQAIRIAVNDELACVERMLRGAVPRLNRGDGWPLSPFTPWRTGLSRPVWRSSPGAAPVRRIFRSASAAERRRSGW